MKSYPVSVPRKMYRGSDARKRAKVQEYNRVAMRVEEHLNADLAEQPEHSVSTYFTYAIAGVLGESGDLIHDIVYSIDCGSNGVTIFKGDYDRAMAHLQGQ